MKPCLTIAVVVISLLAAEAQNVKATPSGQNSPKNDSAVMPSGDAIPDANKVKLLQIQHEMDANASKQQALEGSYQQLYTQFMQAPQVKQLQAEADALTAGSASGCAQCERKQ
jgi:hypothetical protein